MSIQLFLENILRFINAAVIPFLIAIAFLVFIWNLARYFILQSDSEDGREKAKRLALYGILAFVIIVSLWGVVNIVVDGLGFDRQRPISPDYIYEGNSGYGSGSRTEIDPENCRELFGKFVWCSVPR